MAESEVEETEEERRVSEEERDGLDDEERETIDDTELGPASAGELLVRDDSDDMSSK